MVLTNSKLIKHQIYFYQNNSGSRWILPISETKDGLSLNALSSHSYKDLSVLPKHNNIQDYLVVVYDEQSHTSRRTREYKSYRVPKDKYGIELFSHWCMKIQYLLEAIIIPTHLLLTKYPELVVDLNDDIICRGTEKQNIISYKRDILLRELINE